jgi:probable F420-dependent oxidoreductase
MKIGLNFFPINPKFLVPLACRADELGYESIWLGEHVVLPGRIASRHPYAPELGPPLPETSLYDPLITLGFIAAQTKRLKLGTGIYLLALRHPIMAARLVATTDLLSGGRMLLGTGVGWLREEFAVQDVPWEHRGSRMEECIEVMRRLWIEDRVEHRGRFYAFDEVGFAPKPFNGTVPVLVGGETPIALRRAARVADGWFGVTHTPESAAATIATLRKLRENATPLEITVASEEIPTLDEVRRFRDAGVDRLTFVGRLLSGGQRTVEAMLDGLERFADNVIHRLEV